MAKPIPVVLDDLLRILKAIEATIAWRRFERVERPGGITPMGALSDDTMELFDTLCARFLHMYAETRQQLRNRRPHGATAETHRTWLRWLDELGEGFSRLWAVRSTRPDSDW